MNLSRLRETKQDREKMEKAMNCQGLRFSRVQSLTCGAEICILARRGEGFRAKEIVVTCRTGKPCKDHWGNVFKNKRCYALCVLLIGFHKETEKITIRTKEKTFGYSKEYAQEFKKHFQKIQSHRAYLISNLELCLSRSCRDRNICLQQLWEEEERLFSVDPVPGLAFTMESPFHNRFQLDTSERNAQKETMPECNRCKSRISELEFELGKTPAKMAKPQSDCQEGILDRTLPQFDVPIDFLETEEENTASPLAICEDKPIGRLLNSYEILTHRIEILDSMTSQGENFYCPAMTLDRTEIILAEEISRILRSGEGRLEMRNFSELLEERTNDAEDALRPIRFEDGEERNRRIALISAYHSLNMVKVMPYLLDDQVEEIFLDTPEKNLYIDHQRWGRCTTPTKLTEGEIKTLETRARIESGLRLDFTSPSIKTDLVTKDFRARVSIDIEPLAVQGFSLDIRKLRRIEFTLPELIRNETLPSIAAAYLFFLVSRRRNITVIGEPGSGKTTLINSLDLLTPRRWRKITVEDAIESIDQTSFGKHQTRFKVHPFESKTEHSRSKSSEIIKLLHRAPDWIYLGEIQTPEHTRAMFHALSAGLHGLQTTHAASPEEAVHRWIAHHGISPVCLNDLDVVVHIKKLNTGERTPRKVVQVCEIEATIMRKPETRKEDLPFPGISIHNIFAWNPDEQRLTTVGDLWSSNTVQKIRNYERMNRESFEIEIETYKQILEYLCRKQVFEIERNVKFYHLVNVLRERGEIDRLQSPAVLQKIAGSQDQEYLTKMLKYHE